MKAVLLGLSGALVGILPGVSAAQAAKVDLSPAAAARTIDHDLQVDAAAPEKVSLADAREESALAAHVEGLVRADHETPAQTRDRGATGVMWSALRPWKGLHLALHEVRYWYVGRGIDAAIADDGSVTFHDKDGVVAAPLPLMNRFGIGGRINSDANGGAPGPSGRIRGAKVSPGIGITDAVRMFRRHAAHEDPHAMERADFLERTRALRDWLDARARDRRAGHATQELLNELTRIWSSAAALSITEQQAQTFALWDGCDEDDPGARGRAAILDFVHKLATRRGQCPFDAVNLASLNAGRRSRGKFAPCDADATPTQTPRE